jgi:hypothetical protein
MLITRMPALTPLSPHDTRTRVYLWCQSEMELLFHHLHREMDSKERESKLVPPKPPKSPAHPQPSPARRLYNHLFSPDSPGHVLRRKASPAVTYGRLTHDSPSGVLEQSPRAQPAIEPRAPEPRAPEPRAPEPRAPEPHAPEPRAPLNEHPPAESLAVPIVAGARMGRVWPRSAQPVLPPPAQWRQPPPPPLPALPPSPASDATPPPSPPHGPPPSSTSLHPATHTHTHPPTSFSLHPAALPAEPHQPSRLTPARCRDRAALPPVAPALTAALPPAPLALSPAPAPAAPPPPLLPPPPVVVAPASDASDEEVDTSDARAGGEGTADDARENVVGRQQHGTHARSRADADATSATRTDARRIDARRAEATRHDATGAQATRNEPRWSEPRWSNRSNSLTRSLRLEYQRAARDELGKGQVWKMKVFCLFPCLVHLVRLDHICRVLFPLAYLAFVLLVLWEVDFGVEQKRLLASSPCFRA